MHILPLPQLRQTFDYDCGAKALQAVLVYYGLEVREDIIMQVAHTTAEGTPLQGLVAAAQSYGLSAESKEMTIQDIRSYIDKHIPVIIALQAWNQDRAINWTTDWDDGHYVVAIGYTDQTIIFEDPSSFERTYLAYDELDDRWHDVGVDGTRYVHIGIAIYGKDPVFQPADIVHMG